MDLERLLPFLIAAAIILLVSFPVHEFSHALAAFRLGDSTARYMGRLTLDPRAHFDPLGGLMLVLSSLSGVGIGWAKPTPVNPVNLDGGRRGEALVAAAGPLSNLVLAAIAAIPLRIIASLPEIAFAIRESALLFLAYQVLFAFLAINVALFVFNLLPILPLDGWKVVLAFLDARTAYNLRQYEQYGFIVLLLLIFAGGGLLGSLISPVIRFFVGT